MTENQHLRVQMDLTACLCTNLYIKVWEFRQASNFVSLVCSRYFSVGRCRLTVRREIQRYHYLSYWTTVAVLCKFTGNMYLPQYFSVIFYQGHRRQSGRSINARPLFGQRMLLAVPRILKNLKWESLKKRRKDSRLIMLYKGLKGAASIPTNDLVPPIRRTRNHHSLAFQIPMAGTDIYKSSFFPQTIRDWNLVTDSLITASECAVDSVTKFTSLVRARD